MHNDIAFGQYCEGHSVLHRMDPRMKLLLAILYIVVIFLAKSASAFLLLTAFSLCLIAVSGISPKMVLASMKPVLFIIIFTAVINIFWMAGDHLLFTLGPIKVYLEGVVNAVLVVLRILLLLICTSMFLTYTTTPIALTDGLEQALSPLKKLHVPVHEFSMRNREDHLGTEGTRRGFRLRQSLPAGKGTHPGSGPPVRLRVPPCR